MKHAKGKNFVGAVSRFLSADSTSQKPPSSTRRYGMAVLSVLIAFGIRFALDPILGSHASFILFVPAIIIAAWYGGLGPALAAIVLTFVLTNYFFVAPANQWSPYRFVDIVVGVTYIFSALVVVALVNALRRERESVIAKANESAERAELLQREMEQRKRAEDQLREEKERFRAILHNSPAIIFLKDREGHYLLCNPEFKAITHKPDSEIIGKTDHEIFLHEQADAFRANDLKVIEKGVPLEFEEVALHADGPHISIVQKFPLLDSSGKVYATGGIVTDITERKRIEEALKTSEEKYRSLYSKTPVMMHSIDSSGTLISVSQFWLSSLGYQQEEVIGRKSVEFLTPDSQKHAREVALPAFFKSGVCRDISYQMVKKNGEIIDVLMSAIAERDPEGRVKRSLAVIIDVTAQKRAEQALRASEEKLRVLAETAADAIISVNSLGNITQFNRAAEKIFGRLEKDVLGGPVSMLMPARFHESCWRGFKRVLTTGQSHIIGKTVEMTGLRSDGTEFPIDLSLSTWQTAEGKFFTALIRDVSERKQAEEALRRSEEMLRMTTEGARIGLWRWDILNDKLEWNSVEYQQFGLPPGTTINLETFMNGVHPEDRAFVVGSVEKCLRERCDLNFEHRILLPDGTVRWNDCRGRPSYIGDRVVRLSGMSLDITARKLAEEALQQSEELLRTTTEGARIGLWSWDVTNDRLEWNLIEHQQCAIPPKTKMNFQAFLNCIHPEDRIFMKAKMEECLQTKRDLDIEYRIVWPDGTIRWRHCKGRPAYVDNRATRISGMSLDITERKNAEEALRRQAELLNLAQVLVFDLEDKILFWNRGAEKLYGWTEEEAVGKNCHELLRTEFQEPLDQIKRRLFESNYWEGELTHFRKDGEKICVASSWVIYRDEKNRPVAILESNNNITDLKKTQVELKKAKDELARHAGQLEHQVSRRTAQLQNSLKDMESFCYSIAHDLRAPLRAISGFSQSLAEDYAPQLDETGNVYCERINTATIRMNQLISDLLVYGRLTHSELPSQRVNLNSEIEKVLERTAPQIEERHAEIEVDKPLPDVCGDPPVLDQILENLIVNAVKFVPPDRRPRVHIYAEHRRDNIRLFVEDNGIGIPPEQRRKIFQIFERLETAKDYPGTGIGLAIVQRGIEKMGGRAGVESAPEQGSRFWVELPERCGRG